MTDATTDEALAAAAEAATRRTNARARMNGASAPLQLVDLRDFATQPCTRWLIRGILPPDSLVVVFGPPKGGKTFTTADMLLHAAHGMDWHGHRVKRPLRVAYLAGEGRNGLRVRLHAWLAQHDTAELAGAFKVLPASLSLPDRAPELIELLAPFKPDVVVPDTLNAFFGPGDENSTQDMTVFVSAARILRETLCCTMMILHHSGLADQSRERGSIVLRGAADVVIQVAKDESGSGCVGFQVISGRDIDEMDEPIALRLRRVETDWTDDDGEILSTCVVESATQSVTLPGRGRSLSLPQRATIAAVRELAGAQANGGDEVLLTRPDVIAKAVALGASRTAAYRAIGELAGKYGWRLVEPGGIMVRRAPHAAAP
jgi:hypothetical protein